MILENNEHYKWERLANRNANYRLDCPLPIQIIRLAFISKLTPLLIVVKLKLNNYLKNLLFILICVLSNRCDDKTFIKNIYFLKIFV
ncbi:MAG: hypothetical protein A2W74_09325 [Planctomycetes bacterium RIFCSPLOWO2_12_38_17]|nr:MAG: hypothetical protein A2W74_09325 [Planctomycetes bacterium RIFCSPLOWO2_12_38_17]